MKTLITGGSGYIGSHMAVKLIEEGHEVVLFDNLSNSYLNSIDAIKEITKYKPLFIKGDIKSTLNLDDLFSKNSFDNVIHFAAYKAIGESVKYPLKYYENDYFPMKYCVASIFFDKLYCFLFLPKAK